MKIDSSTVFFITGAGSGFGYECSRYFFKMGAKIVMCDIGWTDEASQLLSTNSSQILKFTLDVTNEEQIKSVVQETIKKFNKIDVLINSAGVATLGFTVTKDGDTISNSEIMRVVNINLVGTINVSKYVAQAMIQSSKDSGQKDNGVIINLSSLAGIEGSRGMVAYSLSKGGVIGITLPMARDLGRYGVRVVTLAPQVFNTPMGRSNPGNQQLLKFTPLGRLGEPIELAQAIESIINITYLTGCVIRLDGGLRSPHI